MRRKVFASCLAWTPGLPGYVLLGHADSLPPALLGTFFVGFASAAAFVLVAAATQESLSEERLGSALGVVFLGHAGTKPLGLVAIAPLYAVFDLTVMFMAGGVVLFLLALTAAAAVRAASAGTNARERRPRCEWTRSRVRLLNPMDDAMAIDPQQPIPLYFQLKTLLLEEILSGHYGGEDDRLPTEHELCARYKLSRTPVSRALSELADEGVILRHRRRGSFVNPHWLSRRPDQPEVRVIVPSEGPWARMVRDAAGARNQISVVRVPLQSLHQTLTHAVAEGQAPDLAVLDSVWAPEFAAAGFVHALEEVNEDWVRQEHEVDFLEPLVRANRYEGKTFGVSPFADASGLWYARQKLESLGLDPPTTWEELRAAGHALADDGLRSPMVMPGGAMAGETTAYCLIAVLASNAAHVLEHDGVSLGSRSTAQALRFLRRLVEERIVPSEVVGYDWNHAVQLLAEGRAALSLGGIYEGQALAEALGIHHHDVWEHFGFTRVPAGPKGSPASVAGGMMFAIFRQAAQPRLAMQLLERVVEPEALARVARSTGRVPSRRSAIELVASDLPFLSEVAQIIELAVARPWMPSYPRVSFQLQTMLEAVLTGRLGPAAAAQRTAEMIGAITGLPLVHERERSPAAV